MVLLEIQKDTTVSFDLAQKNVEKNNKDEDKTDFGHISNHG